MLTATVRDQNVTFKSIQDPSQFWLDGTGHYQSKGKSKYTTTVSLSMWLQVVFEKGCYLTRRGVVDSSTNQSRHSLQILLKCEEGTVIEQTIF